MFLLHSRVILSHFVHDCDSILFILFILFILSLFSIFFFIMTQFGLSVCVSFFSCVWILQFLGIFHRDFSPEKLL